MSNRFVRCIVAFLAGALVATLVACVITKQLRADLDWQAQHSADLADYIGQLKDTISDYMSMNGDMERMVTSATGCNPNDAGFLLCLDANDQAQR